MSPTVGYVAAGAAIIGFSVMVIGDCPRIDSTIKLAVATTVGLTAITAVGLAFGFLPAMSLAGFVVGCIVMNNDGSESTLSEKITNIALFTLGGTIIGTWVSIIRALPLNRSDKIFWTVADGHFPIFLPKK